MSLTVDVLAVEPVPLVRLEVGVPGAWEVTGSSGGRSWTVAKGAGPSWLSDPWAPLNVETSYVLSSAGASYSAGPVLRPYDGENALTGLSGRGAVDFRWYEGGGDPGDIGLRHGFFDVPGARFAPYLSAPVAGGGGGSLVARTVGADTRAMRALLDRNAPVVLHHTHRYCDVPDCDIELVRTILVTSATQDRTPRLDRAQREWSLSYRLVPHPWGFVPPVALVSDVPARFATVADLAGSGLSVADLAAGGWLVGS